VNPLSYDQIRSGGYPTSKLWTEVGIFREGIGRRATFDIAQGQRISVNTCDVGMQIIYPPGAIVNIRGNRPEDLSGELQGPGLFLDTILRTSVVPSRAPSTFAPSTLTYTQVVAAGAHYNMPCLPGAIAVDMYVPGGQGAGLTRPGSWVEELGTPATAIIGHIPFSGVSADRSGLVDRPGSAVGIYSLNNTATALVFTSVWHLEF
jgi:hypothetical protein